MLSDMQKLGQLSKLDQKIIVLVRGAPGTREHLIKRYQWHHGRPISRSTLYDSLVRLELRGLVRRANVRRQTPGRPPVIWEALPW